MADTAEVKKLKAEIKGLKTKQAELTKKAGPVKVTGNYEFSGEIGGQTVEKKVKFRDGATHTRLISGEPVPSEELIKAANSDKYKNTDYPGLTHSVAKARMDELVACGYGLLVDV